MATWSPIAFARALRQKAVVIEAQVTTEIQRDADKTLALIRGRTPRRTGTLQAGWKSKDLKRGVKFTNRTPYAAFVRSASIAALGFGHGHADRAIIRIAKRASDLSDREP